MAGTKGYHSYRGRGSKAKIALAVVLALVILAAVSVLFLQEYIVYDEAGNPHLELPWQSEGDPAQPAAPSADPQQQLPLEDVDLTVQAPERTGAVRAALLSDMPLTAWDQTRLERLSASGIAYDAVALTVKDSAGNVYFDTATALPAARKAAPGTAAALAALEGTEVHTVALLSCLSDSRAATSDVEGRGLKNTGGYIFYDGNNQNWLDPAKAGTQSYLGTLAVECAALGFDEILLTDLTFPTVGKLDKIQYPAEGPQAAMSAFLAAMRAALDAAGHEDVLLSVELTGDTILAGQNETAGLALTDVAAAADRIYAPTTVDRAEELAAAVTAAEGKAVFVPELRETPGETLQYLMLTGN